MYSDEKDVIEECGFNNRQFLERFTNMSSVQLTNFINRKICDADSYIRSKLKIPINVSLETHISRGYTTLVPLGPFDEDKGIFYNPTGKVEKVLSIIHNGRRVGLPIPFNCDEFTENNSEYWIGENAALTDVFDSVKCGEYALQAVFSSSGYIQYNADMDLDFNIYNKPFIGCYIKCSDASTNLTFELYDVNDICSSKTFNVDRANIYRLIRLNLNEFSKPRTMWQNSNLFYFRICADRPCTLTVDNLNFNEGWWWTLPTGNLVYGAVSNGKGYFRQGEHVTVDYLYDPHKVETAEIVKRLSSRLAALDFICFLIGIRQQDTAFEVEMDNLGYKADKETLEGTRTRLQKQIDEAFNTLGYGFV